MNSNPEKKIQNSFIKEDVPLYTAIERNPFALLEVSTRDDRRKIMEMAEDKSLSIDEAECSKARADLTNPRNRLTAEISWLPGISPNSAKEFLLVLRDDPVSLFKINSIRPIALCNLMASAFELIDEKFDKSEWISWILAISEAYDQIDTEIVLRHINEDRVISGFPEITSTEQIEKELTARRGYYSESIKTALDRLPTRMILDIVTCVVDTATCSGEKHSPQLIDDLVDKYEIETRGQLQAGAERIENLIEAAHQAAHNGESSLLPLITAIEKSVREWDAIAQPIQLSFKSRGLDHDLSVGLGLNIRNLAVDITNNHGMLEATKRITNLLKEVFAELPEFSARLDHDTEALENLFRQRDEQEEEDENWAKEIFYEADVGAVFKERLSISQSGISWGNRSYPLNQVTRVRWGGVSHSINGIPTGTTYTIAFGDNETEERVELRRKEIYANFLDRLWKAVCVRLMVGILQSLREGQRLQFGDAVIDDKGVELTMHKFFRSERVYCTWDSVKTWSSGGYYFIGSKHAKNCYSQMSYIDIPNVHVLEACISRSFENWRGRLSGLLS